MSNTLLPTVCRNNRYHCPPKQSSHPFSVEFITLAVFILYAFLSSGINQGDDTTDNLNFTNTTHRKSSIIQNITIDKLRLIENEETDDIRHNVEQSLISGENDNTRDRDADQISSQKSEVYESSPELLSGEQYTTKRITLRNELVNDVKFYWEIIEDGHLTGIRQYQGMVTSHGGEISFFTHPGHVFSYVYENVRHYVKAPNTSEEGYIILNADEEDILVRCKSTVRGNTFRGQIFDIIVKPNWAPRGAARFLELVRNKYYDMVALRNVNMDGLATFGIAYHPEQREQWLGDTIPDDSSQSRIPFEPGMVSFSASGRPDSRSTEVFVVMPQVSQERLDLLRSKNTRETPFGLVKNVDRTAVSEWFSYGDNGGPDYQLIHEHGYQYVRDKYPKTDFVEQCVVVRDILRDEF